MRKFSWSDYAPIVLVLCCAAIFGVLLLSGVIDLNAIPTIAQNNYALAVLIIMVLFIIKGFSGVILYNALVVIVSLIFPVYEALLINAVGTAVTLSISYCIGNFTKTERIRQKIAKYPKIQGYFDTTQKYGFVFCFAIHMVGLSMEVLGIIFGMLRIGFWRYLISSWLAIIPGMICFTIMGSTWDIRSPAFWIVLTIDLALIAFGIIYTRKKVKHSK